MQTRFVVVVCVMAVLLGGCSAGKNDAVSPESFQLQQQAAQRAKAESLNNELASLTSQTGAASDASDYQLGPGDVIDITVFQVEELNKTVRINGRGTVILPLVGELQVAGKTTREVEKLLIQGLTRYMHDPEASVFISEYKSKEISVTGAVRTPGIQVMTRSRTLLEALILAGGLSGEAGSQVYVRTSVEDPDSQERLTRNIIVDLPQLLRNPENDFALKSDDRVFVPKAGVVFVEGGVENPGAFQLEDGLTVLKAIAKAGGTMFESKDRDVRVLSPDQDGDGKPEISHVNLNEVRETGENDILLQDGDVVVVGINTFKQGMQGIWGFLTLGLLPF